MARIGSLVGGRFGTFEGVFTPCVLTILGVIMFLRFGQVVGNAGILGAVAIVLAAKTITTLTGFSLAAISTNTRVRGGGAYFLISRSLGADFGGAIGLVFFLAQAVSVSMYVIGFTETLLTTWSSVGLSLRAASTLVLLGVFVCVYIGAGWTLRLQFVILAALVLALASFFIGAVGQLSYDTFRANLAPSYAPGHSMFTMFALFFPAATGIMAGANMSGDLRDPGRSIPRGTMAAIVVTGVIYVAMATLLGATRDRSALLSDALVVESIAWSSPLILAGVFAATISSALGSMMGAPRILQALARDGQFDVLRTFARISGGEPRRAVILTFLIAEGGILVGDLDAIAPVITMFFMITYGFLNLATFYESVTRNPSYRPTFRFCHWSLSLAGAIGCAIAMLLISVPAAIAAAAVMFGLYRWVRRKEVLATWGDVRSGVAFERARRGLLRLEEESYHPKNWRPSIIALSGQAGSRSRLAVFGYWLTGGRGLLTLAQVIVGEVEDHLHRRAGQEDALRRYIREQELDAFPVVLVAPTLPSGVEAVVQCHGIGALRPNLVMIGFRDDATRLDEFGALLRTLIAMKRSVAVVRLDEDVEDPWQPPPGTIDVWWRAEKNGALMLLLAHLLQHNSSWRGRTVRVLRVVGTDAGVEETRRYLEGRAESARIQADVEVLVAEDPFRTLRRHSRDAAVIFMGFDPPEEGDEDLMLATRESVYGLDRVIFVHSAGDADLDA